MQTIRNRATRAGLDGDSHRRGAERAAGLGVVGPLMQWARTAAARGEIFHNFGSQHLRRGQCQLPFRSRGLVVHAVLAHMVETTGEGSVASGGSPEPVLGCW